MVRLASLWGLAVLCAAPVAGRAQPADSAGVEHGFWMSRAEEGAWLRGDHLQHLGLSFTLGLGAGLASDEPAVAASALGWGILKECLDARRAGASRRDLAADALGTTLAVLLVAALTRPP